MKAIEVTADPRDSVAAEISRQWTQYNNARSTWLARVTETRKYVTAPSTTYTEVGSNTPWRNKTTIPILTQIADNLQAFYMAALMPSDDWFRFEGADADSQMKANLVEEYLGTKIRLGGFRDELEKAVRDWIIYGNCFLGVSYVTEKSKSLVTGEELVKFRGPKIKRISPLDCVMDPEACSFQDSPFIVRRLVPISSVLSHNEKSSGVPYEEDALERVKSARSSGSQDFVDQYKDVGLMVDGFQNLDAYFQSSLVEILEYWGDLYNPETGEVMKNKVITIADRSIVLNVVDNPAWNGMKPFVHSGWRVLPDNLYGQGPLENLVGMQYRIDHLENLKADAFDQIIHPLVKISGDNVEDFEFGPGQKIYCGADGDVTFLRPDTSVLAANSEIEYYRNYMEFCAGSPRESAGFRTPGEKTAFEVNVLQQGADRLFQDKLNHFESHVVQPILGLMFELLMRNFDIVDLARTFNGNEKSLELTKLTKEQVVADGIFHPQGAKYFAARNKRVQELQNMMMIAQNPAIAPHFSGLNAGNMFEEELGWEKYNIIEENIGIREQLMTQMFVQQMQQMMGQEQQTPME